MLALLITIDNDAGGYDNYKQGSAFLRRLFPVTSDKLFNLNIHKNAMLANLPR